MGGRASASDACYMTQGQCLLCVVWKSGPVPLIFYMGVRANASDVRYKSQDQYGKQGQHGSSINASDM